MKNSRAGSPDQTAGPGTINLKKNERALDDTQTRAFTSINSPLSEVFLQLIMSLNARRVNWPPDVQHTLGGQIFFKGECQPQLLALSTV